MHPIRLSQRFVSDPNTQPAAVTGGATRRQSLDLVTPDYKLVIAGNRHDSGVAMLLLARP